MRLGRVFIQINYIPHSMAYLLRINLQTLLSKFHITSLLSIQISILSLPSYQYNFCVTLQLNSVSCASQSPWGSVMITVTKQLTDNLKSHVCWFFFDVLQFEPNKKENNLCWKFKWKLRYIKLRSGKLSAFVFIVLLFLVTIDRFLTNVRCLNSQ